MLYKLWHKLFGWDYIQWNNVVASGIARVFNNTEGDTYYWRYKSIKVLDQIKTKNQVVWLTCNSSKYLKTKLERSDYC